LSLETFVYVLQSAIQKIAAVRDDTLDHTAYTAFQEVSSDRFSAVAPDCVKVLGISGKTKKPYAKSLVVLVLEILAGSE
jgi:hypothetical protein